MLECRRQLFRRLCPHCVHLAAHSAGQAACVPDASPLQQEMGLLLAFILGVSDAEARPQRYNPENIASSVQLHWAP